MRRTEIQHNTPEQVAGYLDEALRIVTELEPPEDLREVAFGKAVDLLAAKQLMLEQPATLGMGALAIPRQ